jgi:hypothetical protein
MRQQSWADIPLFATTRLGRGCATRASLEEVGRRFPQLEPLLERERRHRAGMADDPLQPQLPPVVWIATGTAREALRPRESALIVASPSEEDAAFLAAALMLARVWELSPRGTDLAVLDARDRDLPPLWQAPAAAMSRRSGASWEAEVLSATEAPHARGERRYRGPVLPRQRGEIDRTGLVACACGEPAGQCFCKAERKVRKRWPSVGCPGR